MERYSSRGMTDGLVRILVDGEYTELCTTSLEDGSKCF